MILCNNCRLFLMFNDTKLCLHLALLPLYQAPARVYLDIYFGQTDRQIRPNKWDGIGDRLRSKDPQQIKTYLKTLNSCQLNFYFYFSIAVKSFSTCISLSWLSVSQKIESKIILSTFTYTIHQDLSNLLYRPELNGLR